jgi:hypothetical protein
MLAALNQTETEMASFYALFDQQYLGTPSWFKKAFSAIGLYYEDGTLKAAKATWEAAFADTGQSSNLPEPKGTRQGLTVYPNPVTNGQAHVAFTLAQPEKVSLTAFNLQGHHYHISSSQHLSAGEHQFTFSTSSLASGSYLVQLNTQTSTRYGWLIIANN